MKVRLRVAFLILSVALVVGVAALASGGVDSVTRPLFRLVGMFGQVVAMVRSSWVEEVDAEKLEMGAVTGLVEAADPGGVWVPGEHASVYKATSERHVPAFGVVLGKRAGYPVVLQVLVGSPAQKAGLEPGELLEKIDGQAVRARPLWLAKVLLQRAETARQGVELDVIDRYLEGKRLVSMEPGAPFGVEPLLEVRDGVPVVRLAVVDATAAAQLEGPLFPHARAESLVVDLRGTALGSVDGAVALAAALAGGEPQVRLATRDGEGAPVKGKGSPRSWRVIICADNTTAGAAESLALALQGVGATIVGGETYGDTGLRRPSRVAEGELWLAERWCLAGDGTPVLGTGVKPDEAVRTRRGADAVMERALELARGQAAEQAA